LSYGGFFELYTEIFRCNGRLWGARYLLTC